MFLLCPWGRAQAPSWPSTALSSCCPACPGPPPQPGCRPHCLGTLICFGWLYSLSSPLGAHHGNTLRPGVSQQARLYSHPPCSSRGVFPPLCLSCPAHPPVCQPGPQTIFRWRSLIPQWPGALRSSALPHTNGLMSQGLGSTRGVVLGCHLCGYFPGPRPPPVLPGPGALQPESFTSCLPFSPSLRSVAARGIRGLCK